MPIDDVIKRLTVVHTTPGAETAARRIRDVGSAMREAATSSVTLERAAAPTDAAVSSIAQRVTAAQQALTGLRSRYADNARVYQQYNQMLAEQGRQEKMLTDLQIARRAATATARSTIAESGLLGPAAGLAGGIAGFVATAAAIGIVTRTAGEAVAAYRKLEDQTVVLNNVIAMTGGAAGKTTADVLRLADSIGNIAESRQAAQALLAFRTIAGATFDAALRAANDLSASGFGDVTTAAKAMGQALADPVQGLGALEAAGLRFSRTQKVVWQDMVETGRSAEVQRQILARVAEQVGGAGAARSGSLSGAWTNLSDAMQRGSEWWGQSIAQGLRLAEVLNGVASAMDRVNKALPSDERSVDDIKAERQFQKYALRLQGRTPGAVFGNAFESVPVTRLGPAQDVYSAVGPLREQYADQKDRIDAVVQALDREAEALRKTAIERKIDEELRKAQISATDAEAGAISERVKRNDALREANEKRAEAERKAAAEAERARELSARRNLEARQSLETAQLEIDLVDRSIAQQTELRANLQARHQLEQDAARTRTAFDQAEYERIKEINAELGRRAQLRAVANLRSEIQFDSDTAFMSSSDQQIAARLRQVYGGEWRSHMNDAIADQMRFNEVMRQTSSLLESNIASGLADVVMGTKSFKEAFVDTSKVVLRAVEEMAIKMYILRPLMSGLSGVLGGGGGGFDLTTIGSLFGAARGAAFENGRVVPFAAGGVIDRPILFPMARGTGLAGEAGPEAVMPLRRGPDGRLGVAAAGGAGPSRTITVHAPVTVIAPEPQKFNQSRGQVSRTIGRAWKQAQRYS
ncbi:hypothetical protein [Rhodoplanes sp. SY1]|uniref:hypothetical protein n=1 Tax=Rhodoplanes sp. SY1 TaxID=3166646 RepID=UPI0038B679D3